ncbi:MAG: DUF1080 domain-containing protein [Muribaculaceae bacterium]|nr:DUF1080 domain-containing protein [Muribaculaceae bacterium]
MKHSITALLAAFVLSFAMNAQTQQLDSRNRTPETVVSDALAQLPAGNSEAYSRIIGEIAGTEAKGIEMLTSMLGPAAETDNSIAEYAIDGVVNLATTPGQEALRKPVHDALVVALGNCRDNANSAFILSQLNKLASPADFQLYYTLLGDSYLSDHAVRGLANMPGANAQISSAVNGAAAPSAKLAYIAGFRKLQNVEPTLLKWLAASDEATRAAVTAALAECGTAKSINALKASGDTDSYLRLLNNITDRKAVAREAAALVKDGNPALRCAGLRLLMISKPDNAGKTVVSALKDKDAQYRHTALVNAIPAAGPAVVPEITSKFNSYPASAKIDVLEWLADNHVAEQINLITSAISDSNPNVSATAVRTASIIGGDKALAAIIPLLGTEGPAGDAAASSLRSFHGDITSGVLGCLKSDNPAVVRQALALAEERHIHSAYPDVVALTSSKDKEISDAAFKALRGVASASNFDNLCDMLEASAAANTGALQAAAGASIAPMTADERFANVSRRLSASSKPALYYPLLAQTGNADAIAKLLEGYKGNDSAAALAALLKVDSPLVIPELYSIAAQTNGDTRDNLLSRATALHAKYNSDPEAIFYSQVLDLDPSAQVRREVFGKLAGCHTLPAAMIAADYLSDPSAAYEAATALATIADKNASLQRGATMRSALEKAVEVFKAKQAKGDADAGYAVDRVNLMFANWNAENGFRPAGAKGTADAKAISIPVGANMENFDIYFDWYGKGNATVTLRSMSLVKLSAANGISTPFQDTPVVAVRQNQWNQIHIKMVADRLFVTANGEPILVNYAVSKIPGTQRKAPYSGKVAIASTGKMPVQLRRFYVENLPATPVYKLSAEEKAQGFELLFDGRSLENFHGNTTAYVPVDGNIYVTAQYGGTGNLYTKKNYSDFVFRFEFCFDAPAVNNGIGIRTGKDVTGVDAAFYGMEIQVLDHDDPVYQGHPFGYKGLKPYQNHGSIYGVVPSEHVDFGPIKQWHTEEIRAEGDHITVTVDGKVITDANIREACQGNPVAPDGGKYNPYTIDHRNHPGLFNKEGYISFCGHGPGVMFRNVRVLDLTKHKSKAKRTARK